jgi:drug/metabolite transporter (DMT)-like permease
LTEYQWRVLKLLSGLMMLVLGVVLLVWPQALHTASGAAGVLAAALGVTGPVVAANRWLRDRRGRTEGSPRLGAMPAGASSSESVAHGPR